MSKATHRKNPTMKVAKRKKKPVTSRVHEKELDVTVRPFGPRPDQIQALAHALINQRTVQAYLAKTRFRLLRIELPEALEETKPLRSSPQKRFCAVFYDYTNNRTVFARGNIAKPTKLEVTESAIQPLPSQEEFNEAVSILKKHPEFGPALQSGHLIPYPPMPPLAGQELPDGRVERAIAVGLLPREGAKGHEIAVVNMIQREVIRFEFSERGRAPLFSAAHNPICGLPYANQATAQGVAGSAWVTVTQGGSTVWRFLLVRPAASSGTNGSGVELRYVDYKGKRVLYRAHVPILNVKYDADACGPYRDWQNQEGMIQANGSDVAPGFRLCNAPATTILDTGSDVGNYLGVAIYVQGQEVVLVSEMQAGWYRYISQWRLHTDGTIRPRFGFSAVSSSCVCNIHYHHTYWRLDFDIRTAGNNLVEEFNDPPIIPNTNWHSKNFEIQRSRDTGHKRKWRVSNKSTGEAYEIIPGPHDGVATVSPDWPFPKGDVWILRYHGAEIDDGVQAVGPPYEAGIGQWVNGEPINGADVVIWYGAHFTHDVTHEEPGEFGHIVGPELKLVKW
jgi:Copper amine oxidase, enzyme domain